MTHVVHPYAHRLGIIRDWKSRWFSADPKKYREFLKCDTRIREFLRKRLKGMYVSSIDIERGEKEIRVGIHTARPGLVIGRSGEGAIKLKKELSSVVAKLKLEETPDIKVDVVEIRSAESDAAIVASMVVEGLERRMPFRRVLKQTLDKVMANKEVQGARISVSGILGGASMSRKEEVKKGQVPLQTFRADVDFARERAVVPLGTIGIKVWIYKGERFTDERLSGNNT